MFALGLISGGVIWGIIITLIKKEKLGIVAIDMFDKIPGLFLLGYTFGDLIYFLVFSWFFYTNFMQILMNFIICLVFAISFTTYGVNKG